MEPRFLVRDAEVEWFGASPTPVYVRSDMPIPLGTNLFFFQVSLLHGQCNLGFASHFTDHLAMSEEAPQHICSYSTELGIFVQPHKYKNVIRTPCDSGQVITLGVRFSELASFIFFAKGEHILQTIPWPASEESGVENVFAFVSASSACRVTFQVEPDASKSVWSDRLEKLVDAETKCLVQSLRTISCAVTRNLICDELCRDYFRHEGFAQSLQAMDAYAGAEATSAMELERAAQRRRICDLLRAEEIDLVLEMLWGEEKDGILQDLDCEIGLQLLLFKFTSHLRRGDDMAALAFARMHIWPYVEREQALAGKTGAMARDALALLASPLPLATQVYPETGATLADKLNQTLLERAGYASRSKLEKLLIQCDERGERKRASVAGHFGQSFSIGQVLQRL